MDELFNYVGSQAGDPDIQQSFDGGSGNDTLDAQFFTETHNAGFRTDFTQNADGSFTATYFYHEGTSLDNVTDSVTITNVENVRIVLVNDYGGSPGFNNPTRDIVQTGDGDDTISTGAESDIIIAGKGVDIVDGGPDAPIDIIGKDFSDVSVDIAWDINTGAFSGPGSFVNVEVFSTLLTGSGNDSIVTSTWAYDTVFFPDPGPIRVGDEVVNAGAGDDTITSLTGVDTIDGGPGNDTLIFDNRVADGGDISTPSFTTNPDGSHSGVYTTNNNGGVNGTVEFENIENFTILAPARSNAIETGNGADSIVAQNGFDTIIAGGGDDTIDAGAAGDSIDGGAGNDLIIGGSNIGGFSSRPFADTITGGAGADTFVYAAIEDSPDDGAGSSDLITDFQSGLDVIDISAVGLSNIMLLPDANGQVLTGTSGSDQFRIFIQGGAASGDILTGGAQINAGDDTFIGTDGNDFIDGGLGDDLLTGGLGDDTLVGSAGRDTLDGGVGQDRLVGSVREDSLLGGDGADTIAGNNNADYIDGGSGADRVLGGPGDDIVFGDTGSDLLNGNNGVDTINGGVGADTVNGGALADSIVGGAGADALRGNAGNDTIEGNTGGDSILGQANDDLLHGDANNDTVSGNGGNDSAFGGEGADLLRGNAGDDIVYGDDGADQLLGGNGDDVIVGGVGEDRLAGNNGSDVFIFGEGDSGSTLASADLITDFSQAENDVIRLVGIDAIAGGGDDAFDFVGTAAFSGTAGELRYEQSGGNTTVFGDTDGDGTADFALQLLGTVDLVAGDFVL